MALPVLVMPFLTMIFWAFGGGQGTAHTLEKETAGLNLELPDAHFKNGDNAWDKLSLYQKARRDSAKFAEARRTDPYVKLPPIHTPNDTTPKTGNVNASLGIKDHSVDANQERVNKKLNELYKSLNASSPDRKTRYESQVPSAIGQSFNGDVEKLESMMTMMQSGNSNDPEMQEIQTMLDKILDIQHPERMKDKIREESIQNSKKVYTVTAADNSYITTFSSNTVDTVALMQIEVNGFFGIQHAESEEITTGIEAVIHTEQSLVAGSTVKLRLLQEVFVNGRRVQGGQFVFGICAINGERLTIDINSIQAAGSILPVSLSVYDIDGIEGIYVPGAIARDVAKHSSNQALQDIQLSSLNPSLEVQAASTGLETVKNLINKKSRLIKVTIKSGYKVLLVDKKALN